MASKLIQLIKTLSKPLEPISTNLHPSTIVLKNIQCVVFDIYGTLLLSSSGDIGLSQKNSKSEYFLKALQQSGVKILSSEKVKLGLDYFYQEIDIAHNRSKKNGFIYPEVVITEIWAKVIAKLLQKRLIEIKNINIREIAVLFECFVNPVWPMPNLMSTLQYLKSKNIVLGIISNAQFYTPLLFQALTGFTLEGLGFSSNLIEYSFKNGEAKPSSKMFTNVKQSLLTNFNILPANTLYIGNDMLNDIYSAKKEGYKTALFAGDLRSLRLRQDMPQLVEVKPDIVITELNHIIDLVK